MAKCRVLFSYQCIVLKCRSIFLIIIASPLRGKISETGPFLKQGDLPEAAWGGSSPCAAVVGHTLLGGTTERAGNRQTGDSASQLTRIEVDRYSPPWVRARKRLVSPLSPLMSD